MLAGAGIADAQRTIAGFPRSDQSDVAGVILTTGDQVGPMFAEPGAVRGMTCPVAWGVRNAADMAHARLNGGTAAAERTTHALLTASRRDDVNGMVAALAPNENRQARSAARKLARSSRGLLSQLQRVDPANPGAAGATRLRQTVGAYNAYIDASAPHFLASPPAELTALRSVLNTLVIASLENEGRSSAVGATAPGGLACAPAYVSTATPPPPPPAERAIQICVVSNRSIQYVAALVRVEGGDTVTLVAGERRSFAATYPEARSPDWLTLHEPVRVGEMEYRRFGVVRTVRPGEMAFAGEAGGADFYVPNNQRTPHEVIYFRTGSDCELQPYRSVQSIRVRG